MFETREEAVEAGRAFKARMKSTGWKLTVWENMGWHVALLNGPVNIHLINDGRCHILLGDAREIGCGGGLSLWLDNTMHKDPNVAIASQVRRCRNVMDRLTASCVHIEGLLAQINGNSDKTQEKMGWKCSRCGKTFQTMVIHRCNSGVRKRKCGWQRVQLP